MKAILGNIKPYKIGILEKRISHYELYKTIICIHSPLNVIYIESKASRYRNKKNINKILLT